MTTYSVLEAGASAWGDGMSPQQWGLDIVAEGAVGDVFDFDENGQGDMTFGAAPYLVPFDNMILNLPEGGITQRFLGANGANDRFEVVNAKNVTFNINRVSAPGGEAIRWGTDGGVETPTGTVNNLQVFSTNNQAVQHYAFSKVTYNDCEFTGGSNTDDGWSCHDDSIITAVGGFSTAAAQGVNLVQRSTFIGDGVTLTGNNAGSVGITEKSDLRIGGGDAATDTNVTCILKNNAVVGNFQVTAENVAASYDALFERVTITCQNIMAGVYEDGNVQIGLSGASAATAIVVLKSCIVSAPVIEAVSSQIFIRGLASIRFKMFNCTIIQDTGNTFTGLRALNGAIIETYNCAWYGMDIGVNLGTPEAAALSICSRDNFDTVNTVFSAETPGIDTHTTGTSGFVDIADPFNPDLHLVEGAALASGGNDADHPILDFDGFAFQSGNRGAFAFPQVPLIPTLTTPYSGQTITLQSVLNIDIASNWVGATSFNVNGMTYNLEDVNDAIVGMVVDSGTRNFNITAINAFGTNTDSFNLEVLSGLPNKING